jgi:hypothetical protein
LSGAESLPDITKKYAGGYVAVGYERNGEKKAVTVQLRDSSEVETSKQTDDPKGYLGVSPTEYVVQRSTWSAPIVAGGIIKQFTLATFKCLGSAVSGLF